MILSDGEGAHASVTRSQVSSANSSSVLVKLSGEYCRASGACPRRQGSSFSRLSWVTERTGIFTISSLGRLKTYSRCLGDVEL